MPQREHKGASLIDLPETYTIVDLETTGLDPEWCDILEVAALKVENGQVIGSFSELINPGYDIPDFITELTGITDEMVAAARSVDEVLPDYFGFLGDSVLMAHNANFDINFLYDGAVKLNSTFFTNSFVDTLRLARKAYPDDRNNRIKDIVARENLDGSGAHRALNDCHLLKNIYDIMREQMLRTYSIDEYQDLFKYKKSSVLNASDIVPASLEFDEDHLLFERYVVFTGTLESMQRRAAMQAVADAGGIPQNGVNKYTNYLVIGSTEYKKSIKEGRTNKMRKADAMKATGADIEVISESVFLDMIE